MAETTRHFIYKRKFSFFEKLSKHPEEGYIAETLMI